MSQKILVVEDELFMMRLIQHTLEKAGYDMIPARNSEEARAALEQEKPNLVVGDETVVANGVQSMLAEMQKKEKHVPIPVICVTDVPPTSEPGNGKTANLVLTKPFSPTKLVAEVKRLIPSAADTGATS